MDLSRTPISLAPVDLGGVLEVLGRWQARGAWQLHPGDVGWFGRFGMERTLAALRVWSTPDGRPAVVGLLDGPRLLRLAMSPEMRGDTLAARILADDLGTEGVGVVPSGEVTLEVPAGTALRAVLAEEGWVAGERWTALRRDLTGPMPTPALRVETVSESLAEERAAVQRGAFEGSTFTGSRWHAMATGPAYRDARCVLGFADGEPVATVTVWSAGPGRPGLVEPMGVHQDHRGRGYGTAICIAAAAALRDLGASSAVVATPSSNGAAIRTYGDAGFIPTSEVSDICRPG